MHVELHAIDPKPGDLSMSRLKLPPVEMLADEMWIAEKFQSNPDIAGSPRNSFRASLI